LLIVVLFQSWMDPFIIMIAVPGALVGIMWMLAITGSTINVESLMGSIMAVGIATSNSILMVSYANDARVEKHISPLEAALEAGKTRLRPVLMTALAMIIGMVPMAWPGRGRRAECSAGPRRDWRTAGGHRRHSVHRARGLHVVAKRFPHAAPAR
jgi:multidrug efflux pump subunit AcrB